MLNYQYLQAFEGRLLNAWPSLECQFYEGWVARFANGYTKRANSVTPLQHEARLDDELIHHLIAQYRRANMLPIFRLTGLESKDCDTLLEKHGFSLEAPSYCMAHEDISQFDVEDAISVSPVLTDTWLQDALKCQEEGSRTIDVVRTIVSRIHQKLGFATLVMDEQPVAWGLGVVERGYVGLYEFVVHPELRGLGLGKRILSGLIAWGHENGAQKAYLQVTEENEIARSLYHSLGFRDAYRYHYRVLATESESSET